MRGVFAAYWHKDGMDIYRFDNGQPILHASGALDQLQPIKARLHKMILVIGREVLLHVRKRYPLAPISKLTKAVALEIKDLLPLSNPAFYCSIAKNYSAYADVDIWGWEADLYEKIHAIFPYQYVVPEDLAFSAADAQVRIFSNRDRITMLAHAGGRFLDGASCPVADFDAKELTHFLFKLNQSGEEMKRISIFGLPSFQPAGVAPLIVMRIPDRPITSCIYELIELDVRPFKVKTDLIGFLPGVDLKLLLRLGLYLVLGYTLMLSATWLSYQRSNDILKSRIKEINQKMAMVDQGQEQEDYSSVIQQINEKLKTGYLPIKVLSILARLLPQETFLNRVVWNENKVELSVVSKEPMSVVKALSSDAAVSKVSIKGAPFKNFQTGIYTFTMTMELAQ
ncbi:MAG: hypothetical protein WC347_01110 [Smithellaceae bacterium]|jgi:hypothetical protein